MKITAISKLIFLFLVLTSLMACENSKSLNHKNQELNLENVKLEKQTRGNSFTLEIDSSETKKVEGKLGGEGEAVVRKNESGNWDKLVKIISKIDLNDMSNWEAPTQERLHDGARMTTITINADGAEYSSQTFDEGQPPVQLKELYDYLESL